MVGKLESKNMYWKPEHNSKEINLINKLLADSCEGSLGELEEEPITAGKVEVGNDETIEPKFEICSRIMNNSGPESWVIYQPFSTTSISFQPHIHLNIHLIWPGRKQENTNISKLRGNLPLLFVPKL